MISEDLRYRADGLEMVGTLYYSPSLTEPRPGILVFPDAMGISDHTRERARRIAESGYVALACDLHGEGGYIDDLDEVLERLTPLQRDPARMRARARAAFDLLVARNEVIASKVSAIGYCIGGALALELARSGADLAGAVAFHGQITTSHPEGASRIGGQVLVCLGADDPYVPVKHRIRFEEEMRSAGVSWRMILYGGVVHSFTIPGAERHQPEANRYDANADQHSWNEMLLFFAEVFS